MEWLHPLVLWVIAAIALIYFGLGLFNIDWRLRVRILVTLGIGALLVGAVGYPLVQPSDPLGPISMFTGEISSSDIAILILLGLSSGAVAALACYPLGSVLGLFAAPAGVAVLALSGGSMRVLLLYNLAFEPRSRLYASLRWEMFLWLAVCVAGWLGTVLTARLIKAKTVIPGNNELQKVSSSALMNGLIGTIASAAVFYFTVGIFAQDLRQMDERLGSVVGLPGNGQIAFGVFVSVGLAAFAIKYLIKTDYYWAVLGAAITYFIMFTKISGSQDLKYLVSSWPIDYLKHSIFAITPVHFVPFSVLGAMTGYWIAIRTQQKDPSEKE
jgi:hypothetical protein